MDSAQKHKRGAPTDPPTQIGPRTLPTTPSGAPDLRVAPHEPEIQQNRLSFSPLTPLISLSVPPSSELKWGGSELELDPHPPDRPTRGPPRSTQTLRVPRQPTQTTPKQKNRRGGKVGPRRDHGGGVLRGEGGGLENLGRHPQMPFLNQTNQKNTTTRRALTQKRAL